jgi:Condensation domain
MKQLLSAQADLWSACGDDPAFGSLQHTEYLDIPYPIDVPRFASALRRVVAEQPLLRIGFARVAAEVRQFVHPAGDVLSDIRDLSDHPDPFASATTAMNEAAAQPLDFDRAPLLDYRIFQLSSRRLIWYARYHILLTDGFGCWMIAKRLSQIYDASLETREPPAYTEVSLEMLLDDEERYVASGRSAADQAFWSRYLDGFRPARSFPRHPVVSAAKHVRYATAVESDAAEAILAFANRTSGLMAATLVAATFLYLHRMTGEADLLLGLVVAAREGIWRHTPARAMNVVPLRLKIDCRDGLGDIARKVTQDMLETKPRWRCRGADLKRAAYEAHGLDPRLPSINVMTVKDVAFGRAVAKVHDTSREDASELRIRYYVSERRIVIDCTAPSTLYCDDDLRNYVSGIRQLLIDETG